MGRIFVSLNLFSQLLVNIFVLISTEISVAFLLPKYMQTSRHSTGALMTKYNRIVLVTNAQNK